MNILLINHYAGSINMGMEFRPYYLARNWTKSGHQVTILSASFSHLRQKNPKILEKFEEKTVDGVRYCFFNTPCYHNSKIARIMSIMSFVSALCVRAEYLAARYRPDVVIASSTYPFDAYPAEKIAHLAGAKFIYEIHDLWPLTQLLLYGYSPSNPLIQMTEKAEAFAFTHSDGVVSILPDAHRYIAEKKYAVKRYRYIPNGVDLTNYQRKSALQPGIETLKKRGEKGIFIVMYLGGFSVANALEDFLMAARCAPPGVLFAAVGSGIEKQRMKKAALLMGIRNLMLLGPVQKSQVLETLSVADCLYIGAKKTELYRYGVGMNKIYDYMLSGRPIIFAVEASNNPVKEAGCGISIRPDSPGDILTAVDKLKAMTQVERDKMGRLGQEYVRKGHDYRKLADDFIKFIEES